MKRDRNGVWRQTTDERRRSAAALLLALCASGCGETLREIAEHVPYADAGAVQLARKALVASIGVGNWRETRAEAEAKLRTKWVAR